MSLPLDANPSGSRFGGGEGVAILVCRFEDRYWQRTGSTFIAFQMLARGALGRPIGEPFPPVDQNSARILSPPFFSRGVVEGTVSNLASRVYITAICTKYKITFFSRMQKFSLQIAGLFALSAAGHPGDPSVHRDACIGPGRAPWRALWAFKVTKSGE